MELLLVLQQMKTSQLPTVAIANYIIDHNTTVRQTAKKFGILKSTVHEDVTKWIYSFTGALRICKMKINLYIE